MIYKTVLKKHSIEVYIYIVSAIKYYFHLHIYKQCIDSQNYIRSKKNNISNQF